TCALPISNTGSTADRTSATGTGSSARTTRTGTARRSEVMATAIRDSVTTVNTTSRVTLRGGRASPGIPGRSRKRGIFPIHAPDGPGTIVTVRSHAARTGRTRVPAAAYPSTATSVTNPKATAAGTREVRGTASAAGRSAVTSRA